MDLVARRVICPSLHHLLDLSVRLDAQAGLLEARRKVHRSDAPAADSGGLLEVLGILALQAEFPLGLGGSANAQF